MAPVEVEVPCSLTCPVCDRYLQTVANLHHHQTFCHSAAELSLALLNLKGYEFTMEEVSHKKSLNDLCSVINSVTKHQEYLSSSHKNVETNSPNTRSPSGKRRRRIDEIKELQIEYILESEKACSTKRENDCSRKQINTGGKLKLALQSGSSAVQKTPECSRSNGEETSRSGTSECSRGIDNEKGIESLCLMSGDEKECLMGIMKLRSLDVETPEGSGRSDPKADKENISDNSSFSTVSNLKSLKLYKSMKEICSNGFLGDDKSPQLESLLTYNSEDNFSSSGNSLPVREVADLENSNTAYGKPGRHVAKKMSLTPRRIIPNKDLDLTSALFESAVTSDEDSTKTKTVFENIPTSSISTKTSQSFSDFISSVQFFMMESQGKNGLNEIDNSGINSHVGKRKRKSNVTKSVRGITSDSAFRKLTSLQKRKGKKAEVKVKTEITNGTFDEKLIKVEPPDVKCFDPLQIETLMKIYPAGMTDRRFFCEPCGKGYTKKSHLERHLRVHTGERPFPCPHCEKRFAVRSILKQHIRIHTGEKPYSCTICHQRFPQKSGLMTHMMLHTGKPFKCETCHKAFVSNHKLIQHLRIHISKSEHPCNICNAVFYTEGALVEHSKAHKKMKQYNCMICNETFVLETYLKEHLDKHLEGAC